MSVASLEVVVVGEGVGMEVVVVGEGVGMCTHGHAPCVHMRMRPWVYACVCTCCGHGELNRLYELRRRRRRRRRRRPPIPESMGPHNSEHLDDLPELESG